MSVQVSNLGRSFSRRFMSPYRVPFENMSFIGRTRALERVVELQLVRGNIVSEIAVCTVQSLVKISCRAKVVDLHCQPTLEDT